jgi:nitric oxide reductase large subunit
MDPLRVFARNAGSMTDSPTARTPGINASAQRRALSAVFGSAVIWIALGLVMGLFYREFTKMQGYPNGLAGQLALVHTHLLALGALVMLIVLALEKAFRLSASRLFRWFFWIYNAGVLLTGAMMTWHGILDVQKVDASKAIAGIAGTGHLLIGAGFVLLLIALWKGMRREA